MVNKDEAFFDNIVNRFKIIGESLSLTKVSKRRYKEIINIYMQKNTLFEFGLQMEIDCRENDIFIYVIRLKNGNIPSEANLYFYNDGTWCRKYLEEITSNKNPIYEEKNECRYKRDFISFKFSFYEEVLSTNQTIRELFQTNKTGDGSLSSDESNN